MIRTLGTGLASAVLVIGFAAGPAHAGFQPGLIDFCFGVDHPPFEVENPPSGASVLLKADSLRRVPEGAQVKIVITGPGGDHLGSGVVDATGRVLVMFGINSFGTYTVEDAIVQIEGPEGETATAAIEDQIGQSFTVGGDDVPCAPGDLPEGEPLQEPAEEPEVTETTDGPGSTLGPTQTRPQPTEDDGDSDIPWPLISTVVGIPLIFGGFYFWFWPRKRCDWAAYYDQGGGQLKVLRKPRGKECCRYIVKVTSTLNDFDHAAKGRQSPDRLDDVEEAPEGRLRIFDSMINTSCLDFDGWASARSGPFGRLDWMQANVPANAPMERPPITSDDYRGQFRQHEEEPDVAVHISLWEQTDAAVVLESMCPQHENTYVAAGGSNAVVQANQECSNSEPGPECPVEFTALSASRTDVSGDLTYSLSAPAASDVDEMEGAGGLDVREVNGETFYGSHVDSHDHLTRAAATSEQTFTGNGNNTKQADDFRMSVHNRAVLDAGSIVPARVWDTTDEVTADCYVNLAHGITVDASMKRVGCAGGAACCGHGECTCAPKLRLWFGGGTAGIDVDGKRFKLSRLGYALANLFAPGAGPVPWDLK